MKKYKARIGEEIGNIDWELEIQDKNGRGNRKYRFGIGNTSQEWERKYEI